MTSCVETAGQPAKRAHPNCAVPGQQGSIAQQLADLADSTALASNDDDDDLTTASDDAAGRDGALSNAAPITADIPDTSNFHQTGNASWYGTRFHGRKTASGERYDMHEFTAAHRSLPLMSYVRVINTQNHRSVIVKINDRGPFSRHRVLDLSSAAAAALGMQNRGTGKVEIVGMSPSEARAALTQPMLASN
ncbi:septal ring lytic transglycosylase RlpA family protein [Robbsia sp. KACC 23696]|uniref:septal ring lytic transglycosylase RlpA family protein n=1 Tax=Robbsia sp. KACC 23696 TaxID=3149231 RepID=UPI00325A7EE0